MRKLLLACLLATSAYAGERLLGVLSDIGTTKNNLSMAPDASQQWWDGGFEMPFFIPERALITVACEIDTYICTDKASCTSITGVVARGGALFPTSVGQARGIIDQAANPDAGTFGQAGISPIRSAQVSMLETSVDAGFHNCKIFERMGNE